MIGHVCMRQLPCLWMLAPPSGLGSLPPSLVPAARAERDVQRSQFCFDNIVRDVATVAPVWAQHASAIQADAALQQTIVRVLLSCSIPTAVHAAAATEDSAESMDRIQFTMTTLAQALGSGCLKAEVSRQLCQPGALAGVVAAALEALRVLPQQPPPAQQRSKWKVAWAAPMQLVGQLLWLAREPPQGSTGHAGGAAPSSEEWQTATAAVMRAVPLLVPPFLAAAGECTAPAASSEAQTFAIQVLALWSSSLASALEAAIEACEKPGTIPACSAWLQAGAVGLRLQPALTLLASRFRQLSESGAHDAAEHLSSQLQVVGFHSLLSLSSDPNWSLAVESHAGPAEEHASLEAALVLLHSQYARLVHWHVGRKEPPASGGWAALANGLTMLFDAAVRPFLPPVRQAGLASMPPRCTKAPPVVQSCPDVHSCTAAPLPTRQLLAAAGVKPHQRPVRFAPPTVQRCRQ